MIRSIVRASLASRLQRMLGTAWTVSVHEGSVALRAFSPGGRIRLVVNAEREWVAHNMFAVRRGGPVAGSGWTDRLLEDLTDAAQDLGWRPEVAA